MSRELPGFHHCVGTARIVVDIVFRGLRARCVAGGGKLSLEELEGFYAKAIESFSSGAKFFESRHHQCMDASLGMTKMPFARNMILATLLRACGEHSAHGVFSSQIASLGAEWIDELFDGLARYMRARGGPDLEERLINAYVSAAAMPNVKLTIGEFLGQEAVQSVLLECAAACERPNAPELIARDVCDCVNKSIVGRKGWPDVCRIDENQARQFLALLPREVRGALRPAEVLAH